MFMESSTQHLEGHIWLRYATQFHASGRTFTVEVSVPVPVGASAETREQLLSEVDVNMSQLISHIEHHVPQMLQRSGIASGRTPSSTLEAKLSLPPESTDRPTTVSAPETRSSPSPSVQVRVMPFEQTASRNSPKIPPARPNVGGSMPHVPGMSSDNGNILLPQFIQYIKENLGLSPKQAMELLKVKSLSTGINLRDALEMLRGLVSQETTGAKASDQPSRHFEGPPILLPQSSADSTMAFVMSDQATIPLDERSDEISRDNRVEVREERPVYVFDEEDSPEEKVVNEDLDDFDFSQELTTQERERATDLLHKLREVRGNTLASPSRLQVLNNVANSQVSDEQLRALVEGVWEVMSLKKLKVDQVEALISWAKEDDFISEVESVLILLEEGHYARGNG